MRYPRVAEAGSQIAELVASIDVAPTVLQVAGAEIGDHIQGRSLVPLLMGNSTDWRDALLVEFYTYENPFPWLLDMDYRALRTERYKYIHWMHYPREPELYDLVEDPDEYVNLIGDNRHEKKVSRLRKAILDQFDPDSVSTRALSSQRNRGFVFDCARKGESRAT